MRIKMKAIGFQPVLSPCEKVDGAYTVTAPDGACAADLIGRFGIERDDMLVCMINGNVAEWDDPVHDGDELMYMQVMYGG